VSSKPGDHLGPCQLLGLLGAGGMGDVYRARAARFEPDFLGQARQALGMQSTSESYKTFLDIKAKASPGAPLVDEARRSFGVGKADARVSKVEAKSPHR
jgi:hypothetical protein